MKISRCLTALALCVSTSAYAGSRADWQQIIDTLDSTGNSQTAEKVRTAVAKIPNDAMQRIYGNANLSGLAEILDRQYSLTEQALSKSARAKAEYQHVRATVNNINGNDGTALELLLNNRSPGLPDAEGYPATTSCSLSPDRSNADDVYAAQVAIDIARGAYDAAKELWNGLSRACDETLVILGEGGNTSIACIPVDLVFDAVQIGIYVAETAQEHLAFCDGAIDSAEIEGSYERLGHMHTDLSSHAAALATHDSTIKGQLTAHDTHISSQLTQHDTDISNQLDQHDTDISNQLDAHHVAITSQVDTHDKDIKLLLSNLQATVDENQRLLKVSMSRQLEGLRLLITPSGQRVLNPDVLTCTGDDCPGVADLTCRDGSLDWPCKPIK